ncbi:MAG: hypothetical protein P8Y24_00920 [Gammaproteobacteria bacterium]
MSDDGITLSDELIHNIMHLVMDHDPAAQQDMIRALQYLAAISGYLAADYPGPEEQRNELLEHLHQFAMHVANDRASSASEPEPQPAQAAAPAGKSIQDENNPAMGVWKPSN